MTIPVMSAFGSTVSKTSSMKRFQYLLLSNRGTVWSYTTSDYPPPAPFVPATDPYEPITVASVELEAEWLCSLQLARIALPRMRSHRLADLADVDLMPLSQCPDTRLRSRVDRSTPSVGL